MRTRLYQYIVSGAVACLALGGTAVAQTQNLRSSYFQEGSVTRNELNPAFMGDYGYVSFPVLGNMGFGLHTTAGVKDFIYELPDGRLTTFMHESVSASDFVNGLPHKVNLGFDVDMDILSFAFHRWGGYNTFGIRLKSNTSMNMPSDLFRFMKEGMKDDAGSVYHLNNIGAYSTNYVELALGHARPITDQWTVGGKFKLLFGLARARMHIDELELVATGDRWAVTPKGAVMEVGLKGLEMPTKGETGNYQDDDYVLDNNGDRTDVLKPGVNDQLSYEDIDFNSDQLGLGGFGIAIDLGAEYRFDEDWTFSAALLDFGFIHWKHVTKATMTDNFEFDGFEDIPVTDTEGNENSLDNQIDRLADDLSDLAKFSKTGVNQKSNQMLGATLNLAAQYTLPVYRHLKFGLLSTTRINGCNTWSEARLSANIAPAKWFDASVAYGISNFGSVGSLLLNFHGKGRSFFLGVDAPLGKLAKQGVPFGRAAASFNMGINFLFGQKYQRMYNVREVNSL